MKKITSLLSVATLLFMGGTCVKAGNVINNTDIPTKGSIDFSTKNPDTEGEVHKPDEKGEEPTVIEPEGGNKGKGLLRIQYVPDFNFVAAEGISAAARTEPIAPINYVDKGQAIKQQLPAFVQVSDERGLTGNEARWDLQVKATPFKTTTGETLENVVLKFNESTLTMDYKTTAEAATYIEGQSANAELATDGQASLSVLKTKANQTTNGYQCSNVFYDNYEKNGTFGNTNTGITFYKPAGQAPVKDEYTSTLKWTLTDGL